MDIEDSNPGNSAPSPVSDDTFCSGATYRIPRFMIGLGLLLTAIDWWRFGHSSALGFLAGSIISFLNFQWLKSGVAGLADRVTSTSKPHSGKGIVFRFLLRYALMGGAAYAILTSFPASLRGLFVGLFLPVGAIACEAAYETYAALAQKN
jgi:hypothetical protein